MIGAAERGSRRARVLTVIGTRPEGIKLAPVVRALGRRSSHIESRVAITGQHSHMLDGVMERFGIARDYDLRIMRDGQALPDVATACLAGLGEVISEFRPDLVLVQGDTATACFGALAAFLHRAEVGHVEAGLRSGHKWAPYPEEIFRRVSDVLSDAYFAPTFQARDHLLAENVNPASVYVTGNTVVDALLEAAEVRAPVADPTVRDLLESDRPLVLLTAHRRESFGAPMSRIFSAVRRLADRDVNLLFPVHPNPNVRESAYAALADHPRIHLVEPLDYFDLVQVLYRAALVLTDSGGIQEEAPTFGVPVLVLREVTERPEGLLTGVVRLVGTDPALILAESENALDGSLANRRRPMNPYGDGRAAERIADIVCHRLAGTPRTTTDWDGTPTVDVARLDALRRPLARARA